MTYIEANGISKEYHTGSTTVSALMDINFSINKGDFTVILGPSGSGKTTLLNILGGMDQATSGELLVNQQQLHLLKEKQLTFYRRFQVGFVFQFYNLIPTLTALENVRLSQRTGKQPFEAEDILTRVHMSHRLHNFPQALSGGEQQRVSIARAICKNPSIILCDEPTGALDSDTGKHVLSLLKEMADKHGHTILLVTHNASIAQIADRVIHLKDGHILSNQLQTQPLSVSEVQW